ncbi:hypothetical protein LR48_Vigan07g130000 [Vigna angularis]|uniref:Hydroxyproline-rich glycoprotein family protein n=2 Tax=Phaseolus angularis TaxID=3914 RepID=A0A0L9UY24_PHAAN|nr:uncharacterized protein At5g65660 [Vigna angularis]KAG2376692.1 uncharacterized protein HKW66_Vig0243220 [Vigna angularis]KOM47596.1 hypothetical protein LR48_Vigan07g130000 [Vigna angularis]BAT99394.1 hypothetical protein VIGAN_10082200 [Vigna angularis var. angularis]
MEGQDLSPSHIDTSRPSLGFPLGTALLLIIIFSLSGMFSCCYHWDKLRSFRQSLSPPHPQPSLTQSQPSMVKQNKGQSLPVLMPGDELPKFIAMPCPRQPSRPDTIVVTVDTPPLKPPQPVAPFC